MKHASLCSLALSVLLLSCGGGDAPATTVPAASGGSAGSTAGGSAGSTAGGSASAGAPAAGSGGAAAGGEAAAGGSSGGGGGGAAGAGAAGADPGSCASKPGKLGTTTQQLAGTNRSYVVHTPPSYKADVHSPVVLMLHGLLGTPADFQSESLMNPAADAAGFVAVYPAGLSTSWNAGACCGDSAKNKVDDVGFLSALVDQLVADYCIDPKRVFAAGMSNGGMMSHRLACELSEKIAAIGPVAGTMAITSCSPKRPVPVFEVHGTSDPVVPYAVDGVQGTKNAPATTQAWATRNGCTDKPAQVYSKGDATCVEWSQCKEGASVRFCTIDGGGHQWPGGNELPFVGKLSKNLDSSAEMLTFFAAHPMP